MRKSKMASQLGVLGGISPECGIVPPAAARVAHANLPESDPVLQRLLSDDEIAAIKQQRLTETPSRNRQHSHSVQVQRDSTRNNIDRANRRKSQQAKSSAPRHRNEGEAFRLGRAAPLTKAEEVELLGGGNFNGASLTSEPFGDFPQPLENNIDLGVRELVEKSTPRNQTSLPTNPVGEQGGESLVSNVIGTNPRPQLSSSRRRSSAGRKSLNAEIAPQASLEPLDSGVVGVPVVPGKGPKKAILDTEQS